MQNDFGLDIGNIMNIINTGFLQGYALNFTIKILQNDRIRTVTRDLFMRHICYMR